MIYHVGKMFSILSPYLPIREICFLFINVIILISILLHEGAES